MNKYIGENRLTYLWGKIKAFVSNAISGKVDKVSSSTDNAIVRFDGTSGNIQNSGVTIDDSNNVSTSGNVSGKDIIVHGTYASDNYRKISSGAANNMYVQLDSSSNAYTTWNTTEFRRGAYVTNYNLGSSTYPWNNVYGASFITIGGTSSEFVKGDGTLDSTTYAPLASPALTGTPTAPTAASGTNTTQIATTAFVQSALPTVPATYTLSLNATKPEGWYRVAKLGKNFSGMIALAGQYYSAAPSVATFAIAARQTSTASDIIQLGGNANGNIDKIRLVVDDNSIFYLDIYKATSGNIGNVYVSFNGVFDLENAVTNTVLSEVASTYIRETFEITDITENTYQTTSNLVTSISSSSTDTQYPSAKCVYDLVGNIETLLASI